MGFHTSARGEESRRGRVAVNQGCRERNVWFYESLQTFFTLNEKRQHSPLHKGQGMGEVGGRGER